MKVSQLSITDCQCRLECLFLKIRWTMWPWITPSRSLTSLTYFTSMDPMLSLWCPLSLSLYCLTNLLHPLSLSLSLPLPPSFLSVLSYKRTHALSLLPPSLLSLYCLTPSLSLWRSLVLSLSLSFFLSLSLSSFSLLLPHSLPLSLLRSLYCLTPSFYLYWLTLSLSLPFRHIGHVGWDPNTGFDVSQLLHVHMNICIQVDS